MDFLTFFRQLYLLLWKNYVLRKRKKIRTLVEIVWPLLLFVILLLVRTTGLRSFNKQCHYGEVPLASSGILPLFQGYFCHAIPICSLEPVRSLYDFKISQITNLTFNWVQLFNQPQVADSLTTLAQFGNQIDKQIIQAQKITSSIQLSSTIYMSLDEFEMKLVNILGINSSLNANASTLLVLLTSSNPNFNYLYSNYSQKYIEPDRPVNVSIHKSAFSILYGPDLDRLDSLQSVNLVDSSIWLRSQMCNNKNPNYLLRGANAKFLANQLCTSLTDSQLTDFFTLISSQINFSAIIQSVYKSEQVNLYFINAAQATISLQRNIFTSSLFTKNATAPLNDIWNQFQTNGIQKTICGRSDSSNIRSKSSKRSDSSDPEKFLYIFINSLVNLTYNYESKGKENSVNLNGTSKRNLSTLKIIQVLNNWTNLNESACPAQLLYPELREKNKLVLNTSSKSCLCKAIYAVFVNSTNQNNLLVELILPIISGKIFYTPDTPEYRKVISRAEKTFRNIENISQLLSVSALILDQLLNKINIASVNQRIMIIKNALQLFNQDTSALNFNVSSVVEQLQFTAQALRLASNLIDCVELNKFTPYASEDLAVSAAADLLKNQAFWAAVVFNNQEQVVGNVTSLPEIVSYKIRMISSSTFTTNFLQDRVYKFHPRDCFGCNRIINYGFAYIQDMIEKAIIEVKSKQDQIFGLVSQMMPYPCYIDDIFLTAIGNMLPLIMVIAWIYTVSMLVKDIVYEKEKRLKEFMRVMGLSNGVHWLAWFITSFTMMFFVIFILAIMLKYGEITTKSDLSCLIVFLTCFVIATITQCFLISVFFSKANIAAVVAAMIYFLLFLPYAILVNYEDTILTWQKFLASLSSTVAFSYGCRIIAAFELQNIGVTWSTFYTKPFASRDGFTFNSVCLIMLFDSVVYMLLVWYIEGIKPGEFGIPRRWYFPVQPSYWLGEDLKRRNKLSLDDDSKALGKNPLYKRLLEKLGLYSKEKLICDETAQRGASELSSDALGFHREVFESENVKKGVGIRIDNLHKIYSRGNNHALKGLSVNFYQNEISAFLGHNGAGKSTTMHILIGLYKPTVGTAYINGLEITQSMDTIRKSLGFVPQHNVLFDSLTVSEHLWFYARLKGLKRGQTKREIEKMLDDTGLTNKRGDQACNLSGGMQRKLSVAIAFVGGSKTVILDEPSAGVDPNGRRGIWDLLLKNRVGRTILISTHHMDEADVLGDRISIISNGKLIAYGTSYFMKNQFGSGYYLTLVKKQLELNPKHEKESIPVKITGSSETKAHSLDMDRIAKTATDLLENFKATPINEEERVLKSLSPHDKIIDQFIRARMPSARLVQNMGAEIVYSISNNPEFTCTYNKFFAKLEKNTERLGIESIGLSEPTLEEIFIKLAKEPEKIEDGRLLFGLINVTKIWEIIISCSCLRWSSRNSKLAQNNLTEKQIAKYSEYTKYRVSNKFLFIYQQFYALLIKRFHRVKRNIKGFIAEIVLPVIFVILALLVATLFPIKGSMPPLEIHPWYYQSPNQIFISKSSAYTYDRPRYDQQSPFEINLDVKVQTNIDQVNGVYDTLIRAPGPGNRCLSNYKIALSSQAQVKSNTLACNSFESNLNSNYSMPPLDVAKGLLSVNYSNTKTGPVCDCSNGFPSCPAGAEGDIYYRPVYTLKTKDILYDLSGRNISDWLINTEFTAKVFRKRFGGFEFLTPFINKTSDLYNQIRILGRTTQQIVEQIAPKINLIKLSSLAVRLTKQNVFISNENLKIWFNNKGFVSSTAYLNVINNALLRSQMLNMNSTKTDVTRQGIVLINHPLPFTKVDLFKQIETAVLTDLFVTIFIIFALSFIPASFLVFLVEEKQNNSKQLQFVSGVKPFIYWISNFTWDLINYTVPCIICLIIFLIFNVEGFVASENFPCLVLIILLYGWACIPLMYTLSFLFKIPSNAFVLSSSLNVFIGIATTITVTVLDQLGAESSDLLKANNILKPILIIFFPQFCLGNGLLRMVSLYYYANANRQLGLPSNFTPFGFNDVGRNLLALVIQGCVFFIINLLIQYKFFVKILRPSKRVNKLNLAPIENEDSDVLNEKNRILKKLAQADLDKPGINPFKRGRNEPPIYQTYLNGNKENESTPIETDYIRLVGLTKVFRKFKKYRFRKNLAVNRLYVGINKGECFGLIGVNGAGKTTTFKMITGEIPMTAGEIYVDEHRVSSDLEKVHQKIGYCPQFDAIFPLLTAREHLMFYARLRGIPKSYLTQVCQWALHRVGLQVFADKISGNLSGGNKRKLSTAIALVGDPAVICLDEPTSGMDAKARRLLWNDILSLTRENRIVILTTHSMEEAEALCTRLVIMVNGQFKCLGSPQYLKAKFGRGYLLKLRLNNEAEKSKLFKFMSKNFPKSSVQYSQKNYFEFLLPFLSTKLSLLFQKLEKNREALKLRDYSISQPTLDQIFINFAKQQLDGALDQVPEAKSVQEQERGNTNSI